MQELIDKMVMYRAKHQLTQQEMADKIGVSLMTLNQIEVGKQIPSRITVAKIQIVLDEDK